jgi:hypothetical protein
VHSNLVSKLRTELVKRISGNLDQTRYLFFGSGLIVFFRLETLLEQSFPFISFDELKVIPMTILTNMKVVPVKFLKQLSANKELYDVCNSEILIINHLLELSHRSKTPNLGSTRRDLQR